MRIWMGTPVVSLVGKTTAGRAGLGILSTVGLPELVANDSNQFIEIAVGLAGTAPVDRRAKESSPAHGIFSAHGCRAVCPQRRIRISLDVATMVRQPRFYRVKLMNPASEMQLALEHHQSGRLAEAEKIYRRVLARQPDHVGALNLLGVLATQTGRVDAAVQMMQRAITLMPGFAEVHYNLGNALQIMGRLDEAIAAYRESIRLKPGLIAAYNNLANTLKKADRLDEAIATFREALRLQPDLAEAHSNLGNALKDLGLVDEAITCYRRRFNSSPTTPIRTAISSWPSIITPVTTPE